MNIYEARDQALREWRDKLLLQEKLIANVALTLGIEPKNLLSALTCNYVDITIGQVTQMLWTQHHFEDEEKDADSYWMVNRWR